MASSPGSNASLSREKTILSESSQAKKSQYSEEESFYMNCRAAYLAVFKSSLENIKSKEQLYLVLQQAGRNPSQKTVNQYWTPQTTTLNFDDFCNILKKEKPATKTELLKAFLKVDTNNDGYILHTELYKILTMRGERMTVEEVNAITKLADVNSNGKLDYNQFCKLYVTTNEQCRKTALEKLEVDSRLRRQQFGSQVETSSERATSPISKPSSRTTRKTDHKPAPKRGDNRTSSRPSSAQSCKASVSSTISMGTSSNTNSELIEPNTVKDWQCAQSKGCFFLEEDGEIITHKYRLYLPQRSTVYITIKPLNLSQLEENFDTKKNELTRQGFMDLNLMEANDREGDPSDLWVTLLSLGYNKALEMTAACPFVINIYAEKCKPRIKAIYLEAGSRQLNRAICKSVVNKGDAKVLDSGESIIVYTYKSDTRITSVIENKSENKVVIHVNNEQSKNCVNNRGLNIFAVEVAPKSMMVCQHVMPLKEQEEWIYNCVHSLIP
ncbi:EF-hand calcium-binding domain-containing protein 7 [Chelonia mydas]|uniref:EF-hand calcium-binding domain-containing protein 7 n=1 Tax=Chelonia mydas TaxID=8469 RepID=M7B9Y7_CHEMY|nr:EF-hand calcium-binding domain-containing protein 7 [Chelonia mydas]